MRMKKLTSALFCLYGSVAAWCAPEVLVADGNPTEHAFFDTSRWKWGDGVMTGGNGCSLYSRRLYSGDVTVEAEISLHKLDGTAAALIVNGVTWGFDGGKSKRCFAESVDAPLAGFDLQITPERFFKVRVECAGGVQRCFIDGRELGAGVAAPAGADGEIYLRPHRNVMDVKNFTVTGRPSGILEQSRRIPVWPNLVNTDGDFVWRVAGADFPAGKPVNVEMIPDSGTTTVLKAFPEDRELLAINAKELQSAYAASRGACDARRFLLRCRDGRFQLYVVLADPARKPDFPLGEVRSERGSLGFYLDGKPVGTMTGHLGFFMNHVAEDGIERFGRAGVHGSVVLLETYRHIDRSGNFDESGFMEEFSDMAVRSIVRDPEIHFKVYFLLNMPPEWCEEHPEELIVLDNRVDSLRNTPLHKRQPSYASEVWRRQMGDILRRAVTALRRSSFADRVGLLRLRYANCGEWNNWGYHEKGFTDYSEPMRRAFASWLKTRYGSVEELRAAWKSDTVSFDSPNLIPGRASRLSGGGPWRPDDASGRATADYYEFFQWYTVDTILYFARIAKDAGDRRLLVSAYYAYYFGHFGSNPYHFHESGHYGLRYILESPDIDSVGGPYPYDRRRQFTEVNGLADSVALHGKLWESEGDLRTSRSGKKEAYAGGHTDPAESVELLKRDFMINLQRRAGFYFYDFARDWYADPEFMATVKRLREIDFALRRIERRDTTQVAVIFDEASIHRRTSCPDKALIKLRGQWRTEIPRWGVPAGYYLKTDLSRLDPKQIRMLVFADNDPDEELRKELLSRGFKRVCGWLPDAVSMRKIFFADKDIHVWTSGKSGLDQACFALPVIGMFSYTGGAKTIWLPEEVEIAADLFTGEILGRNTKKLDFDLPRKPSTKILFVGDEAEYRHFTEPTGR